MRYSSFSSTLTQLTGSPRLLYIQERLEQNVELLRYSTRDLNAEIYFALKACYHLPILRLFRDLNVGAEIMTEMEWDLAMAAGFRGGQIVCNGLGRSNRLLSGAARAGALVVIDSLSDLQRFGLAALHTGREREIGLRVKPDMRQFAGNPYGRQNTKLGIPPFTKLWEAAIREIARAEALKLTTLHANFSINETSVRPHIHAIEELYRVKRWIESRYSDIRITRIDLGGGFLTNDRPEKSAAFFRSLARAFAARFPDCTLALEPGRYLVNNAGYVVATVTEVKKVGGRHFIITDATTNVLIPIPTANYRLEEPMPHPGGKYPCTVADGITSPHNVVIANARLTRLPKVGDRMVLGNCGAYTQVMGEFWAYEPFPVALIDRRRRLRSILSRSQIARARRILLGV